VEIFLGDLVDAISIGSKVVNKLNFWNMADLSDLCSIADCPIRHISQFNFVVFDRASYTQTRELWPIIEVCFVLLKELQYRVTQPSHITRLHLDDWFNDKTCPGLQIQPQQLKSDSTVGHITDEGNHFPLLPLFCLFFLKYPFIFDPLLHGCDALSVQPFFFVNSFCMFFFDLCFFELFLIFRVTPFLFLLLIV